MHDGYQEKVMKRKILAAGICGLMLSTPVSASILDFNSANLGVSNNQVYNSVGMSVDGINLSITAYTITSNGSGAISALTQVTGSDLGVDVRNNDGGSLGVKSSLKRDSVLLDGHFGDEGLLFNFDQQVRLDFIDFDNFGVNPGDHFNLTVDGATLLSNFNSSDSSIYAASTAGSEDEFNFYNLTGSEFLFWAYHDDDQFRIDRMEVSAVAEPALLSLFSLGFAGLFLSAKLRK